MHVTPLSQHIGALIEGIDLNQCDEKEFAFIYRAFLEHKVIFFRDQFLSPKAQLALAARFGELEAPHPFFPHAEGFPQVSLIETTRGNPPGKSFWHTDMTWQDAPPKCSVLSAQHLPDKGGDTIWASMEAAYDALPRHTKAAITHATATHAVHGFSGSRFDSEDDSGNSRVEGITKNINAVHHPLVVKHPETGKPALYVNEQFTRFIDKHDEGDALPELSALFEHSRGEAFQVRFQWEVGSVAIWDNRCTQHFAVTDYGDTPRKLHRVVVKGSIPASYDVLG
ncbi:TauD/TfdA dioxygenase family protein [Enterovibrio baiacu]|uniref:TauD/TfdA dioxygenase family protein n=1 Tax=Enterovibrio baiacu TaxID=2491023 RepID=UPI0010119EB5|nr:TauD/TfdA family dioxygenase [Enterovibrio baiacu]MBE1274291.1 taurine catabolism dioxygenase [Enterovibrio baiacu]